MNTTDKPIYYANLRSDETEMLDNATELAVWYAIKSCAGGRAKLCFASERELARRARVTQDTIGRVRESLAKKGVIEILGKKKAAGQIWATWWLRVKVNDQRSQVNDSRSDMNDQRSQVNDTAEEVNDSTDTKYKVKSSLSVRRSTKETAWTKYSPRHLKDYSIEDPGHIAYLRDTYLARANVASETAVAGFIRNGKDDYATKLKSGSVVEPSDDEIYPDITAARLREEERQVKGGAT